MEPALNNYIRAHRRNAELAQWELGLLLGGRSRTTVYRLETARSQPDLDTAIACQLIFDVALEELFPGRYRDQAQAVARNLRRVAMELPPRSPRTERKLDRLDRCLARLSERQKSS